MRGDVDVVDGEVGEGVDEDLAIDVGGREGEGSRGEDVVDGAAGGGAGEDLGGSGLDDRAAGHAVGLAHDDVVRRAGAVERGGEGERVGAVVMRRGRETGGELRVAHRLRGNLGGGDATGDAHQERREAEPRATRRDAPVHRADRVESADAVQNEETDATRDSRACAGLATPTRG